MWQGTGSTKKWNLSCYNPRILPSGFVWFCWFVHRGGARQRQHWHLISLWTRVGRRWQIVWQGTRCGSVAETGIFVTTDALSTISCFELCFLLSSFSLLSFSRSLFGYVSLLLRITSSVQQSSSPRQQSTCVPLVSFAFLLISEFLLFHVFYIFVFLVMLVLCSRIRYVSILFAYFD